MATTQHHNPKHIDAGKHQRLNVLVSNGRFPVTLDLARQLKRAKHHVYCVDPMQFHVCKFSNAVSKSWQTPPPSEDPAGYIEAVGKVVRDKRIDLIIPCHEEILYLAECPDEVIKQRLYAPAFWLLYQLHNKWEFSEILGRCGLDRPEAHFLTSVSDVQHRLDPNREWALKPVLGRSSTGVKHLKAGEAWDWGQIKEDVSPNQPHIAQEWLCGNRYCTYGIFRSGRVQAFTTYPVMETIDGSSSVYFEAVDHEEIKEYACALARKLRLTGQFAFDFIETGVTEGELHRAPHGIPKGGVYRGVGERRDRLKKHMTPEPGGLQDSMTHRIVSIECNPRSTSGIHLWSRTPKLAMAITDANLQLPELAARPGRARQTGPGMMMWEHKKASSKRYLQHLGRLLGTKDVMWSWSDLLPVLMQPFLLAGYYRICHDKGGMPLPEMFQSDVVWYPRLYEEGESGKTGLDVRWPLGEWAPERVVMPEKGV
jgi:hypothetical protein